MLGLRGRWPLLGDRHVAALSHRADLDSGGSHVRTNVTDTIAWEL
jgi:hypothetical protein